MTPPSIRHPDWDYRNAGAYFVTICTHERQCIFGNVVDGEMRLNALGQVVIDEWRTMGVKRKDHVQLDVTVVMPNHLHGVLWIKRDPAVICSTTASRGATNNAPLRQFSQPKAKSLSTIIGGFKSAVTRVANRENLHQTKLWQPRFHDRIIRNDTELRAIQNYILLNPEHWTADDYFD